MSMCHMAGCPLAIPDDNTAAAEPCPLSGDNWWVLPCHLGQETLHTGTSPWPPCTSQLKLAPPLCSCKITWRGHEVSQHFYILLFIICFARYIPFSLKSTTVYCLVS